MEECLRDIGGENEYYPISPLNLKVHNANDSKYVLLECEYNPDYDFIYGDIGYSKSIINPDLDNKLKINIEDIGIDFYINTNKIANIISALSYYINKVSEINSYSNDERLYDFLLVVRLKKKNGDYADFYGSIFFNRGITTIVGQKVYSTNIEYNFIDILDLKYSGQMYKSIYLKYFLSLYPYNLCTNKHQTLDLNNRKTSSYYLQAFFTPNSNRVKELKKIVLIKKEKQAKQQKKNELSKTEETEEEAITTRVYNLKEIDITSYNIILKNVTKELFETVKRKFKTSEQVDIDSKIDIYAYKKINDPYSSMFDDIDQIIPKLAYKTGDIIDIDHLNRMTTPKSYVKGYEVSTFFEVKDVDIKCQKGTIFFKINRKGEYSFFKGEQLYGDEFKFTTKTDIEYYNTKCHPKIMKKLKENYGLSKGIYIVKYEYIKVLKNEIVNLTRQ